MTAPEIIPAISGWVATLTFVIGVGTFIKAIVEYRRQNATKRFEIFQGMNKRFDGHEFTVLRTMLDDDSVELAIADQAQKNNFLGFFEEIAMSVNTGVMNVNVAFYMFGYYAIECWNSKNFWLGEKMLDKNSVYWSLFASFVRQMQHMESALSSGRIDPRKLRF